MKRINKILKSYECLAPKEGFERDTMFHKGVYKVLMVSKRRFNMVEPFIDEDIIKRSQGETRDDWD